MKALGVLESKWNPIRQKLVRRLLEEQDKVLRSYFAQKGGTRGQRRGGTHDQGREHVKWDTVRVKQELKVCVAKMRDQGECTGWVEKVF